MALSQTAPAPAPSVAGAGATVRPVILCDSDRLVIELAQEFAREDESRTIRMRHVRRAENRIGHTLAVSW